MSAVHLIFIGLLIFCSYHDASAEKNRSPCLRNEFKCKEDGKCIPVHWRCDADFNKGLLGCSDGSHKLNCDDNHCLEGEHRCGDGRCIPASWVCDGRSHCFDRSDEKGCSPITDPVCLRNQFRCTNGKCIPILHRCNGNNTDCSDGTDESKWCQSWCPEGYVRCNNTLTRKCIPKSYLCNGEFDCPDKSDESDCDKCEKWGCAHDCDDTKDGPQCLCKEGYRLNLKDKRTCLVKTNPVTCLRNEFACADGKECSEIQNRCNVTATTAMACTDGSHMADCDKHQCLEGEHRCGNGLCIPSSWVCDGITHCIDESDEQYCEFNDHIQDPVCLRNQFRCRSGTNCIPIHERCNGFGTVGGCPDHSDELECPENWCPEGYLRCDKAKNDGSKNCIQKSLFCDGERDCEDGSDEKDCDKCENWGCSHYCKETLPWPKCLCKDGYKLDHRDKRNCTIIGG